VLPSHAETWSYCIQRWSCQTRNWMASRRRQRQVIQIKLDVTIYGAAGARLRRRNMSKTFTSDTHRRKIARILNHHPIWTRPRSHVGEGHAQNSLHGWTRWTGHLWPKHNSVVSPHPRISPITVEMVGHSLPFSWQQRRTSIWRATRFPNR
jgi:hypothetical protein